MRKVPRQAKDVMMIGRVLHVACGVAVSTIDCESVRASSSLVKQPNKIL